MDTKGFTLIEVLIVVALIALISAIALPGISSYYQVSINSATRELASAVKEAYHSTVVTGRVHRIAYDLAKNEYWVESGPDTVLLDTKETQERDSRRKRFSFSTEKEKPSPFQMEKSITRKKQSLPIGVSFEDVVTQQAADPMKTGIVFTHFFPQGMTEQTLIHLKDSSQHQVSLVISSLVGRTDLYGRYIDAKEAFSK